MSYILSKRPNVVDIYACPIFKWVAETRLHHRVLGELPQQWAPRWHARLLMIQYIDNIYIDTQPSPDYSCQQARPYVLYYTTSGHVAIRAYLGEILTWFSYAHFIVNIHWFYYSRLVLAFRYFYPHMSECVRAGVYPSVNLELVHAITR